MASDQQVTARSVLDAVMEIRRLGNARVMRELEAVEPDLASWLMESLSMLHSRLMKLGGRPKATQAAYMEVETLALACITALRKGHLQLWQDAAAGTPLERLDAADASESGDPPHHTP